MITIWVTADSVNSLCKIHDALKHQVWNWSHSQVWLLPKGYQKCCFWFYWNSVELLILLSTNTNRHSQINLHVLEESLSSVTRIGICKKLWLKSLTNYMHHAGIKPVLQPMNINILKKRMNATRCLLTWCPYCLWSCKSSPGTGFFPQVVHFPEKLGLQWVGIF